MHKVYLTQLKYDTLHNAERTSGNLYWAELDSRQTDKPTDRPTDQERILQVKTGPCQINEPDRSKRSKPELSQTKHTAKLTRLPPS